MEFQNQRVAVTGASGGIGQAITSYLVAQGLSVFGLDRVEPPGAQAGVTAIKMDVTDPASVEEALVRVYETGPGAVDLVCCAGIVEDNVAAEDMSTELFDSIMAVNLRGVFLSCRSFGRELLARGGGSIVNIASMSGNHVVNFPQRQCAYNASKAGVTALTKSLAVEWGPRGVRVNAVSPGYVQTPLLALKTHQFHHWMPGIVLGRFGEPDEVARAVAFLLSNDSSYCCGTELLMDGGFTLR
jgi:NAD(P)-dependent dehydrogenase (short-subunit alcohol dehydrogenase family)